MSHSSIVSQEVSKNQEEFLKPARHEKVWSIRDQVH